MTQGDDIAKLKPLTTTATIPTLRPGPPRFHDPKEYDDNPTDTIAAVTIAILAVVIVITLLLIFRALRKRRRARQGEQFGTNSQIQTLTTGVMGTGELQHSDIEQVCYSQVMYQGTIKLKFTSF